jgi:hypothetical protein
MRWIGHAACMGRRKLHKGVVGKAEEETSRKI